MRTHEPINGANVWIALRTSKRASCEPTNTLRPRTRRLRVVARLLVARGFTMNSRARNFSPVARSTARSIADARHAEAVARMLRAIDAGEKILVYGDYDVDGTTGTVVLRRALRLLGARHGLSRPAPLHGRLRHTAGRAGKGARRTATRSSSALTAASARTSRSSGRARTVWTSSSQIITCRTKARARLRPSAVLNPNQRGCNYPDKNLAGVGVAFKLAHALFRERGRERRSRAF